MKKGLKIILEVFLILLGLLLVLAFLAFSAKSEIVPDIYVTSESGKTALAVKGGYEWNSFSESVVADSIAPQDYVYKNDNVLLVTPEEKMTFQNSENPWSNYKFYQLEMKYYDEYGNEVIVPTKEDSKSYADLKYLEMNAPIEEGTYVYHFRFSYYNKGEVSYGLKVVVSTEPNYEITDLVKYRNTSLKDIASIQEILDLLPYAKYENGLIVRTNSELAELQVNYQTLAVEKEDLVNNTIALFTLIPELEWITYKTENETVVYTRTEIENQVGRNLSDYAGNVELWKQEILFKEPLLDEQVSRDEIYKTIIQDTFNEKVSGDRVMLIVDTESFAENELLELSNIDRQEILEYASNFADVVYDMTREEYEKIHSRDLLISLSEIRNPVNMSIEESVSGDKIEKEEIEKGKYICTISILENRREQLVEYEVQFLEEKWNVKELLVV